mmetsp:Transcript_23721/g.93473  ORF Transcript_23721/g.93473 Transcript_23721/m.93473 type:complete len:560 (+) Transcript_23721:145-1824(+)
MNMLKAFVLCLLVLQIRSLLLPRFVDISEKAGILAKTIPGSRNVSRENSYWSPAVADMNRDGRYDLMMSNHGDGLDFYWSKMNTKYKFKSPGLYRRDIHGLAIADMSNSWHLNAVITRGGGAGTNPGTGMVLESGEKNGFNVSVDGAKWGLNNQYVRGRSCAFMDTTGNGYLDLLYINRKIPGVDDPSIHLFYENQRDGTFRVRKTGFEHVNAAWFHLIDFNEDGYMDVLLMTDDSIQLWEGTGRFGFKKTTGVIPDDHKMRGARCACELDFDGDGMLDLYIARGKNKKQFDDVLLRKRKGYVYENVSVQAKIPKGGKHYHVTCGDFNNDGYADLYISQMTWYRGPNRQDILLMNKRNGTFKRKRWVGLDKKRADEDGDSAIAFDHDLDGRLDLLVGYKHGSWHLFRNLSQTMRNNWVIIRVGFPRIGRFLPKWNRNPIGATVRLRCDGRTFVQRTITPGASHSQSYYDTLHFGLGRCASLERLVIRYTNGIVVVRNGNIAVNRVIVSGLYYRCRGLWTGAKCARRIHPCQVEECLAYETCEKVVNENIGQTRFCPITA